MVEYIRKMFNLNSSVNDPNIANMDQFPSRTNDCRTDLKLEEEVAQRMKLADWEQAAEIINNPTISVKKSTTTSQINDLHFSDYTLYPDRFCTPENRTDNLQVRRGSLTSEASPSAAQISRYSFSIRSPSVSESTALVGSSGSSSDEHPGPRPRSGSQGMLHFFDFSRIRDRGSNPTEGDVSPVAPVEGTRRRRLYSTGDVASTIQEPIGQSDVKTPGVSIQLIVPKAKEREVIIEEAEVVMPTTRPTSVPPRKRKTSAPPRFCFFDYSMIPDKDPRWIGKKKDKDSPIK